MVSSIYLNTKKSYYKILKEKLSKGNEMYTVYIKDGLDCYSGLPSHQLKNKQFNEWVEKELPLLEVNGGSIIPVDESIFKGFPQQRYESCTGDTTNWTHPEYWDKKQSDYVTIKAFIDKKLEPLRIEYENELLNEEQNRINEEKRLEKERKAKEIEEINYQILLEKTKREGEEKLEDERIKRLLSSLGIQSQSKPSSSFNTNNILLIGGVGLVLLGMMKK